MIRRPASSLQQKDKPGNIIQTNPAKPLKKAQNSGLPTSALHKVETVSNTNISKTKVVESRLNRTNQSAGMKRGSDSMLGPHLKKEKLTKKIPRSLFRPFSLKFIVDKYRPAGQNNIQFKNNRVEVRLETTDRFSDEASQAWNSVQRRMKIHKWDHIRNMAFRCSLLPHKVKMLRGPMVDCTQFFTNMLNVSSETIFVNAKDSRLQFSREMILSDQKLIFLGQRIKQSLINLQHLTLSLHMNTVTGRGLKQFGHIITSGLHHLDSLDLELDDLNHIKHSDYCTFFSKICLRKIQLKHLRIILNNCEKLSVGELSQLGSAINHLNRLKSLKLKFSFFNKTLNAFNSTAEVNVALLPFFLSISHPLPQLTEFSLSLEKAKKGDFKGLGICLAENFTNLRKLTLNFGNWENIRAPEFAEFGSSIAGHMTNLQYFEWNFCSTYPKFDEDLKMIGHSILLQLSNLKTLRLSFSCEKISDSTLEAFVSETLSKLPNLNQLKLFLPSCDRFTGDSLKALGKAFAHLKQLDSLDIALFIIFAAKDDGLKGMISEIAHLSNLKRFKFHLSACQGVRDKGMLAAAAKIQSNMQKLQSLSLNFTNCSGIDGQCKSKVKEMLKFIPKLEMNF